MEELIEILKEIKPGVDFEKSENLIEEGILDSFDIISLVSAIDNEMDVNIEVKDIIPENFNSVKALYSLILKLKNE